MKLDTSSYYPDSPLDDDPLFDSSDTDAEEDTPVSETEASAPEIEHGDAEDPSQPYFDPPETPAERNAGMFATLVSWIFSPLLMPVYGIMLIFGLSILNYAPFRSRFVFTMIVLAFNVGVPALLVLLLKRMGIVEDVGLNNQKERTIPYIVTILCMGGTAVFLACKGFPLWAAMFFAGGAAAGLVEMVVNAWWKISAHAAGVAGIVGLLLRMSHDTITGPELFTWLLVSVGCAGLIGSARLWLGRHTLAQVMAGYAVGFCAVYFLTMIH